MSEQKSNKGLVVIIVCLLILSCWYILKDQEESPTTIVNVSLPVIKQWLSNHTEIDEKIERFDNCTETLEVCEQVVNNCLKSDKKIGKELVGRDQERLN